MCFSNPSGRNSPEEPPLEGTKLPLEAFHFFNDYLSLSRSPDFYPIVSFSDSTAPFLGALFYLPTGSHLSLDIATDLVQLG
jgi:hypothetical protein